MDIKDERNFEQKKSVVRKTIPPIMDVISFWFVTHQVDYSLFQTFCDQSDETVETAG